MADIPALTTTFTPSPSCLSNVFFETVDIWPAYILGNTRDTASCFPQAQDPLRTSFFSPGLYCPSDYTKACSSIISVGSAVETQATCCPIGGFNCKTSTVSGDQFGCTSGYSISTVVTVTTSESGAYQTTSYTVRGGQDYLNAFSVQLRWQSSDLATATSTGGSASTGTATSSDPASSSSMSSASQNARDSGLSTGAKIGLGVGIPLAATLGALLVLVLVWARKRKANAEKGPNNRPYDYQQQLMMDRHEYYSQPRADSNYAAQQPPPPQEMDGNRAVQEIGDSPR